MPAIATVTRMAPEHVEEVETAGRKLFAAVEAAHPENLRYAVCRFPDGRYLTLIQTEGRNPLLDLPEFHEFMAGFPTWADGEGEGGPVTVLGSYRLF
jgi:hypothetical protein